MAKQNLVLGKSGENIAVDLLKEEGYKILATNFRTKLGEIDIVAKDKDTLCFIEVKTRCSDRFGLPFEAISASKQRQISKVALLFLKEKNLLGKKARFDVVSVSFAKDFPKINVLKNAFDLNEEFTY